jgi:sensor histidine kinase YesM
MKALSATHRLIPFRSLLKLLLAVAVSIQLVVIIYSHMNDFYVVDGVSDFLHRFLRGASLSLLATFLVAYPDLTIIQYLNRVYPWKQRVVIRVALQLMGTITAAVVVSTLITLFSHVLNPYPEGLVRVLIINAMIFAVSNIILMIILEAWIFFIRSDESQRQTQKLEQEIAQIRFEVLKNQINPHFMFNSLNVLSGLISKNPQKAQKFVGEFSQIYRYVLETIEQPLVSLQKEIQFASSYMNLQQLRYGEYLTFCIDLPTDRFTLFLPPLSLQVVLENAIKHNRVSSEEPLHIELTEVNNKLIIRNNLQPKISSKTRIQLGQKNLIKRYEMISSEPPQFQIVHNQYEVTLPLIEDE